MGKGILNELFDLSGDVLSALGSFFGLGEVVDDNIFRDDVARGQANAYRARLTTKLTQLKERNAQEYSRIISTVSSLSRTRALNAENLRNAIKRVNTKAQQALNKDNELMAKVEAEIADTDSDLMSSNISRRRKYIPQNYKASYRSSSNYTPFEGSTYTTEIENQINKEIN
jgi:hypothetical protein